MNKAARRLTGLLIAFCLALGWQPARAAEEPTLNSLDEVKQYLSQCAGRLDEEIAFSYDSALDEVFSSHQPLQDMLYNVGMDDWRQNISTSVRRIYVHDIQYLQGFRMARAWQTGNMELLGGEEQTVLGKAEVIAQQARERTASALELERYLHDYLCQTVTYGLGDRQQGFSVNDTAVGALHYNVAECDGYTDAFYLLGTMAGLNVGYQTGRSEDGEGHIWNVVQLNGQWHHVDVTWDDRDSEDAPIGYRYFNCGSDMMTDHLFDDALSMQQPAQYTDWDTFFYTCGQEGFGAYYEQMSQAAEYVARCWKQGAEQAHVMVKGVYPDVAALHDAMKQTAIRGSWVTWYRYMGEYTCFDLIFQK